MKKTLQEENSNKSNTIIYLIYVVTTILFLESNFVTYAIAVLLLMDIYVTICYGVVIRPYFIATCLIIIIYIFFISLLNHTETYLLVKEVERFIIYLLCDYGIQHLCVEKTKYFRKWFVIILYSVFVQLCEFFDILGVEEFILSFYNVPTDSSTVSLLRYDSLLYFRSGSFFVSENPFFKLITAWFVLFLVELFVYYNSKLKRICILGIILSMIACVLNGSRTCSIIIFITALLLFLSTPSIYKDRRKLSIVIVGAIAFAVLLYIYFSALTDIRSFTILLGEGGTSTGSMEFKINQFLEGTKNESLIQRFFGMGIYDETSYQYSTLNMDSDFGFMYMYYGIFSIYIYYRFYKYIYICNQNKTGKLWVIGLILASFTSGVILNYRVFASIIVLTTVKREEQKV